MADPIDRISPLLAVAEPGRFGRAQGEPLVHLSDRMCESLVQVQAWPEAVKEAKAAIASVTGVKVAPKMKAARKKDVTIMPSGPGRWLIEDERADLEMRLRDAIDAETGAVTGLTHARVVVTISGERAVWTLASGIALDFDEAAFPIGTVQQTRHHAIGVTIHRTAKDAFELYVSTSYARGFWQWITGAAAESGYTVS